jgi:hypothetical protein
MADRIVEEGVAADRGYAAMVVSAASGVGDTAKDATK